MYKFIFILSVSLLLGCKNNNSSQTAQSTNLETALNITSNLNTESSIKEDMEIVFCLDATGSMRGLISTAKEKIWDIVSEVTQNNSIKTIRLGMIFYRDRGDSFITKPISLSTNIDNVYAQLLEINAAGGGDTPESVNQALFEAVNTMQWSKDKTTYRTIFVVGDCPPHMDYKDDVLYTESCKQAAKKQIIINTIKLGSSCTDAITHFKAMSDCTNGSFLQLDQHAKDQVIETPFDEEINDVSRVIDNSRLYYGSANEQQINNENKRTAIEVYDKGSKTANSSRASFKSSKYGMSSWMGSKEIIKDYKENKFQLNDITDEELPEQLKGKTLSEKKEILEDLKTTRDENISKLKALSKQRSEYINKKMKEKNKDSLSFSKEVLKIMKKQSTKVE